MELNKSKLVVVEGKEETLFLPRLLKTCNKSDLCADIQFLPCDGKDKLDTFLKSITKYTGFNLVRSIGIILDANGQPDGIQSSLDKTKNALSSINFPVPTSAGIPVIANNKKSIIWIMPNNKDNGELEDLCLNSLKKQRLMPCIQKMRDCIKKVSPKQKISAKSLVYTYLAWLDPPGKRLGEISNSEIGCWDCTAFEPLLSNFFSKL